MGVSNKILLTGGLGYIGSHAAAVLLGAGKQVILFDNMSNSDFSVLGQLEKITGAKIPFVEGDVQNERLLEEVLTFYEVDAVIHFAGLKSVGESTEFPLKYFSNNISGSISLLNAMQKASIKKIVFSSSATVYGVPEYFPIDENHSRSATNPYGRSKLIVEDILQDVSRSNPDLAVACLRYFNPVGAHASGLIGESPVGRPNNLMPFVAQVADGLLDFVSIFGDDYETLDGTGVRDYIHVMDLVEGHLAALNYLDTHSGFQSFNLGTGRGYSVLEMIKAYETASGDDVPYKIVERREGDVPVCFANSNKAKRLMGWQALRGLNDMCLSAWSYQKALRSKVSQE